MTEYHTLSKEARDAMHAAKNAVMLMDRANAGMFATESSIKSARAAAKELSALAARILLTLPIPEDELQDAVLNFRRKHR